MIVQCIDPATPIAIPATFHQNLGSAVIMPGNKQLIPQQLIDSAFGPGLSLKAFIDTEVARGRLVIVADNLTPDQEFSIAVGTLKDDELNDFTGAGANERTQAVVGSFYPYPNRTPDAEVTAMPASIAEPPENEQTREHIESTLIDAGSQTPASDAAIIERTGQPANTTTALRK